VRATHDLASLVAAGHALDALASVADRTIGILSMGVGMVLSLHASRSKGGDNDKAMKAGLAPQYGR